MAILAEKRVRAHHANQLIANIATYGRRFFHNAKDGRTASMEVDDRGHIWFVDDYRGARIYTHKDGCWNRMGFTHGGTLRSLVLKMRDYISTGKRIDLHWIAPTWSTSERNVWGYEDKAAEDLRRVCTALPIIVPTVASTD